MLPNPFKKKKHFVLEHEILRIFYNICLTGTSTGSEAAGHIPIYKRFAMSARMDYSVLVDILNTPEKYSTLQAKNFKKGGMTNYAELTEVTKNIKTDKFNYTQVSNALEVLESNGHLKEEILSPYTIKRRLLTLTERGMLAFIGEFYLKKYLKDTFQVQLARSTINTNKWMIGLTMIIAVSTVLGLVCNKPKDYVKELQPNQQYLEQLLKEQERRLDSVIFFQKELHRGVKQMVKNLPDSL